jgi:hypothetical protein
LIVPTLVPVPVATGDAVAGVDAPMGAAVLVWAIAEITKRAATARNGRRNLLVIGSLELLGT